MDGLKFLSLIAILLTIPLVMSASPFINTGTGGISIEHPITDILTVNKSHDFHFHVFNSSDGRPFLNSSNVKCTFHLYNIDGGHIVKYNNIVSTDDLYDWEVEINGKNFSDIGQYSYVFQCNNSILGGFYEHEFTVTRTGSILSTAEAIVYILFLFAIFTTFLLCLYGSVKIPFRNTVSSDRVINVNHLKYLKIIFIFLTYSLLLFIFGITRSILENYLFINGAYQVFNFLFQFTFAFMFPLIIVSLFIALVNFLTDKKIQRAIARGVPIR